MEQNDSKKIAIKISVVTIVINILLTLIKLVAGIFASSYALISDAVHSASDVFSTFIVILGIKIALKNSDESHPFGHDRFECVAAILLSFILAVTGFAIGYAGIKIIVNESYKGADMPFSTSALIVAFLSIVTKEAMYWYTRSGAKKINSGALMADAWHHRSDSLSSIGSVVAIIAAKVGAPIVDPIASIVICLFILRAAIMIFSDAVRKMTDEAMDEESINKIRVETLSVKGVRGIDSLKTRRFGDSNYVEMEIEVLGTMTLKEAHDVAEEVHDAIEKKVEKIKHCAVHVNPTVENELTISDTEN